MRSDVIARCSGVGRSRQLLQPRLRNRILKVRANHVEHAITTELLTGSWVIDRYQLPLVVKGVGEVARPLLQGGDCEYGARRSTVQPVGLPVEEEETLVLTLIEPRQLYRSADVSAGVHLMIKGSARAWWQPPLYGI